MAKVTLRTGAVLKAVQTKKQKTVQTSRGDLTAQPGEYILQFNKDEKTVISEKAYKKLFKPADIKPRR